MARRTLASVERELRALLLSDAIQVRVRKMHDAGQIKDGRLDVDPTHAGMIPVVIHELLHHRYYHELARWGQLEEYVVLGLEEAVVRFINRSARRVEWWRASIDAKLD